MEFFVNIDLKSIAISILDINAHLVLVTKNRRKVLKNQMLAFIQ